MAATVSVSYPPRRGLERQAQVIGAKDSFGRIVLRDRSGRDCRPPALQRRYNPAVVGEVRRL